MTLRNYGCPLLCEWSPDTASVTDRSSPAYFGIIHFSPRLLRDLRVSVVKLVLLELFQKALRNDVILARHWAEVGLFSISDF